MVCVVATGNIDDVLNKAYETLNYSGTDFAVIPEDVYARLCSHTHGNVSRDKMMHLASKVMFGGKRDIDDELIGTVFVGSTRQNLIFDKDLSNGRNVEVACFSNSHNDWLISLIPFESLAGKAYYLVESICYKYANESWYESKKRSSSVVNFFTGAFWEDWGITDSTETST